MAGDWLRMPGQHFNAWHNFTQNCWGSPKFPITLQLVTVFCSWDKNMSSRCYSKKKKKWSNVKLYLPALVHAPKPSTKLPSSPLSPAQKGHCWTSFFVYSSNFFKIKNMLQILLKVGLTLNYLWYVNLICTGVFCFTLCQITSFHSEVPQNNKMDRNYFHSPSCHHLIQGNYFLPISGQGLQPMHSC